MLRNLTLATVTAVAAFLPTAQAQPIAVPYAHIDQLACRLEKQTQLLHREVDLHFKRTQLYAHLHTDIAQMERLARHIHDVALRRGSVAHLRTDVNQLDRLYHHVEDLVRALARDPRIDLQTISHLARGMAQVEQTLHHLQEDLRPVIVQPLCPFEAQRLRTGGYIDPHGHGFVPVRSFTPVQPYTPPVRVVVPTSRCRYHR